MKKLTPGSLAEAQLAAEPGELIHCMPVFPGERTHEESVDCWCDPAPLSDEPSVIVHNRKAEA